MRKYLSLILIISLSLLIVGCNQQKEMDKSISMCIENCLDIGGATKAQCESQCNKAENKFDEQSEELETSGKKDSSCEKFSSQIAVESCYAGLAMDTGDVEYCDNIVNSASRSECVDNVR